MTLPKLFIILTVLFILSQVVTACRENRKAENK